MRFGPDLGTRRPDEGGVARLTISAELPTAIQSAKASFPLYFL